MDVIEFVICPDPEWDWDVWVPVVNGRPLVDIVDIAARIGSGYSAMRIEAADDVIAAHSSDGLIMRTVILWCSCGDPGCGHVEMTIGREPARVMWQQFVSSRGEPLDLRFAFDRGRYERAMGAPRRSTSPIYGASRES